METRTYTCKTITPMLMHGSKLPNRSTPILEFRSPSVKGVLRFWWRAIHGDLSIENLQKTEGKYFGWSGENKAPVQIRTFPKKLETKDVTPFSYSKDMKKKHKKFPAFSENQEITIQLRGNQYIDIFDPVIKITSLLGGFGQKSRRGYGSVCIQEVNGEPLQLQAALVQIYLLLEQINPGKYLLEENKIVFNSPSSSEFPHIKEIYIGNAHNSFKALLLQIMEQAHDHDCLYTGFTGVKYTEFANSERMASPIYVSVIQDADGSFRPIVTKLKTVFKSHIKSSKTLENNLDESSDFIEGVLS